MSLNSCFDIYIYNETLTIYICTQTCVLCQQAAALREGLTVTRCHRRNVTSHHSNHSVLRLWQFSFPWQFSQPLALSSNDRHIVQHHLQDHLNHHLLHILIQHLVEHKPPQQSPMCLLFYFLVATPYMWRTFAIGAPMVIPVTRVWVGEEAGKIWYQPSFITPSPVHCTSAAALLDLNNTYG